MMKILKRGRRSIYDDSPWVVGTWREDPEAEEGAACGRGFHSLLGDNPLVSPVFAWPCEVWRDECEDELGRDTRKARYRRQRIVEDLTSKFPVVVRLNEFIGSLKSVPWFKPTGLTPPSYMRVEKTTRAAARGAAWNAAWNAARAAAEAAAEAAAWAAAGAAYALLVSDLNVDTTWLHRWWRAWEMGYYPIREDGDTLVVADVS